MSYKLNLTKALNELDLKKMDFYEKLSDDEKKGFQPFVLLRYMSSVPNNDFNSYYALMTTNEIVNVHFWELSKEPELQAKLLATCGMGKKSYHKWIPLKSSKKASLDDFVKMVFKNKNWFPNKQEIDIFLQQMSVEDIQELCREFGMPKDEEKRTVAEFKKLYV